MIKEGWGSLHRSKFQIVDLDLHTAKSSTHAVRDNCKKKFSVADKLEPFSDNTPLNALIHFLAESRNL